MITIFCHQYDRPDTRLVLHDELPDDVAAEFLDDLRQLIARHKDEKITNSKKVIVKAINESVFNQYLEDVATSLPSGTGKYAQPLYEHQQFLSANELSKHLGFNHNEIAMALSKVKSNPEPSERYVVRRGVTVMYDADDALLYHD